VISKQSRSHSISPAREIFDWRELHREKARPIVLVVSEDGCDVRTTERRQHLGLALETGDASGSPAKAGGRALRATSRSSLRCECTVEHRDKSAARMNRERRSHWIDATVHRGNGRRRHFDCTPNPSDGW
jgi:hypothetical protein